MILNKVENDQNLLGTYKEQSDPIRNRRQK